MTNKPTFKSKKRCREGRWIPHLMCQIRENWRLEGDSWLCWLSWKQCWIMSTLMTFSLMSIILSLCSWYTLLAHLSWSEAILNLSVMSCVYCCIGMVYSREGTHGRMECMALTVQFYPEKTSLTISKWRIRLVAFSTFPHFCSTKLLEALVASESGAVLRFQFLSLILLEISLY